MSDVQGAQHRSDERHQLVVEGHAYVPPAVAQARQKGLVVVQTSKVLPDRDIEGTVVEDVEMDDTPGVVPKSREAFRSELAVNVLSSLHFQPPYGHATGYMRTKIGEVSLGPFLCLVGSSLRLKSPRTKNRESVSCIWLQRTSSAGS